MFIWTHCLRKKANTKQLTDNQIMMNESNKCLPPSVITLPPHRGGQTFYRGGGATTGRVFWYFLNFEVGATGSPNKHETLKTTLGLLTNISERIKGPIQLKQNMLIEFYLIL